MNIVSSPNLTAEISKVLLLSQGVDYRTEPHVDVISSFFSSIDELGFECQYGDFSTHSVAIYDKEKAVIHQAFRCVFTDKRDAVLFTLMLGDS